MTITEKYFLLFSVLPFLLVNASVAKSNFSSADLIANLTTESAKRNPSEQSEYKPPQQQTEYYAVAPVVINYEEGNYFEGDIILRPDQISGLVSIGYQS